MRSPRTAVTGVHRTAVITVDAGVPVSAATRTAVRTRVRQTPGKAPCRADQRRATHDRCNSTALVGLEGPRANKCRGVALMADVREVEIKYRVHELAALETALHLRGVTFPPPFHQDDQTYAEDGWHYSMSRLGVACARLRTHDGRHLLASSGLRTTNARARSLRPRLPTARRCASGHTYRLLPDRPHREDPPYRTARWPVNSIFDRNRNCREVVAFQAQEPASPGELRRPSRPCGPARSQQCHDSMNTSTCAGSDRTAASEHAPGARSGEAPAIRRRVAARGVPRRHPGPAHGRSQSVRRLPPACERMLSTPTRPVTPGASRST
jgi:hypothetical protein